MITVEKGAYKREDKDGTKIERRRFPLNAYLRAHAGEEIVLTAESGKEPRATVCVKGNTVLAAEKRPMSCDDFEKQLRKTGDSDFIFDRIEVDTDGGSFVRVAEINSLRRRAIEEMKGRLTDGYKRSL